jgi:DNA-binding beta-propeller fold protein YncE
MIRWLIVLLTVQTLFAQSDFELREIVSAEKSPLRRPSSLAIGASGLIYVADTGNNRLVAIDSTGAIVLESSKGGSAGELRWPSSVAVGNGERVYVADAGNKRIVEFTRLLEWKGELSTTDESGATVEPRFVAVDNVGDLFVFESDNGQIVRYDSFYNVVARLGAQSGYDISAPSSITYSAPNGLLWTSHGSGELYSCDAFLNSPRKFSGCGGIDYWQVAAQDSTVYGLSDTTLIRCGNGINETLALSALNLGTVNNSDLRLEVSTFGLIYLLDTRSGSLHRLYWP